MKFTRSNITLLLVTFLCLHGCDNSSPKSFCEGYDSATAAFVTGECEIGFFDGIDSETKARVYGKCAVGGNFQGSNEETESRVTGWCSPLLTIRNGKLIEAH